MPCLRSANQNDADLEEAMRQSLAAQAAFEEQRRLQEQQRREESERQLVRACMRACARACVWTCPVRCALCPVPYALHHAPCALHPAPCATLRDVFGLCAMYVLLSARSVVCVLFSTWAGVFTRARVSE